MSNKYSLPRFHDGKCLLANAKRYTVRLRSVFSIASRKVQSVTRTHALTQKGIETASLNRQTERWAISIK